MQQQYRLRLGEGTLLLVDRDALNTWLVDERAMVQPVGSKRWKSLRQFIKDEKEAAYFAPAPAPAAPAANEPPRATRLEDVLVPPPPKTKAPAPAPAAVAAPLIVPVEEPSFHLPTEPQAELAIEQSLEPPPALNEPLKVTNLPFAPVEEERPRVEVPAPAPPPPAPPPPAPAPPKRARAAAPPPPPPPPPEPPPAPVLEPNLFASLQEVASETLKTRRAPAPAPPPPEPPPVVAAPVVEEETVVDEEEIWTPPAPQAAPEPEPEPQLTEEELELTRPRMTLQEYGKPAVPAPVARKTTPRPSARPEPPPPSPAPLPPWEPKPEPTPEPPRAVPEPMRAEPIFARAAAPLQVLADETAGSNAYSPLSREEAPLIALKPLDDEPARDLFEPDAGDVFTPPPPKPNVVETAAQMMTAWGGILQGWVSALDRRDPRARARQEKPVEIAPTELEPLDEVAPGPPRDGLATVVRRRAKGAAASLSAFASTSAEAVSGWIKSLRRDRPSLSLSLPRPTAEDRPSAPPRPEPIAAPLDEDFRESPATPRVPPAAPVPALKPPPTLTEMPALRLAPVAEAEPDTDDVYEGSHGPSLFDNAGALAKKLVLAGLLVVFGIVVWSTWEVWLPRAGGIGVKVVDEIQSQVNPQQDRVEVALSRATQALPHLAPETVSLILNRRGPVDPVEVFDTAQDAAARGVASLTAEEAGELAFLRREMTASLSPVEQVRLRDYDRLRRVVPSAEEGSVIALMAEAVASLSPQRQQRLQILNGKAVTAGLGELVFVPPAATAAP